MFPRVMVVVFDPRKAAGRCHLREAGASQAAVLHRQRHHGYCRRVGRASGLAAWLRDAVERCSGGEALSVSTR